MFCSSCKGCLRADCSPGHFGANCSKPCNPNCRALACSSCACVVCDISSGECVNGCDSGWYGPHCDDVCSDNCYYNDKLGEDNGQCEQETGHCLVGCLPGFYGNICNNTCAEQCAHLKCQRTTGACVHGCISGYQGSFCQEKKDGIGTDQIAGALGGAFVVLLWGLVVIVLICVMWRRRRLKSFAMFNRNTQLGSNRGSSRRRLRRHSSASSNAGGENGDMQPGNDIEFEVPEDESRLYTYQHETNDVTSDIESPVRFISRGSLRHSCNHHHHHHHHHHVTPGHNDIEMLNDTRGHSRENHVQFDDVIFSADIDVSDAEDLSKISDVWKPRTNDASIARQGTCVPLD